MPPRDKARRSEVMTTITLDPSATAEPGYTLEVASALALSVQVLNHLTREHAALECPQHADRVIREIATAAGRLPQLLEQVNAWLAAEQEAGRIAMAAGGRFRGADLAADVARLRLEQASAHARALHLALDQAAEATSGMMESSDEGSGE